MMQPAERKSGSSGDNNRDPRQDHASPIAALLRVPRAHSLFIAFIIVLIL